MTATSDESQVRSLEETVGELQAALHQSSAAESRRREARRIERPTAAEATEVRTAAQMERLAELGPQTAGWLSARRDEMGALRSRLRGGGSVTRRTGAPRLPARSRDCEEPAAALRHVNVGALGSSIAAAAKDGSGSLRIGSMLNGWTTMRVLRTPAANVPKNAAKGAQDLVPLLEVACSFMLE